MNEIQTYKLLQSLIDIKEGFSLTEEDISFLKELVNHRGWLVFLKLLKREFAREYDRLRYKGGKIRNDFSFGRICGTLEGLEIAEKIVKMHIESHNSQGREQEE
jgi:hypothetical protein